MVRLVLYLLFAHVVVFFGLITAVAMFSLAVAAESNPILYWLIPSALIFSIGGCGVVTYYGLEFIELIVRRLRR